LTGQRLLYNYMRIGGVNGDLNHEFMSRLGDWMSHASKRLNDNQRLLNENEIFVKRTRGLGVLDRATALRYVVTGPPLRATGVPYDVRRAHPYSVYAMSDGTDQPFRLRIHDPSFFNLQAVTRIVPGTLIADLMAILASLDPIMGGVDK
jgi:NADH:ubiquinone oxidoreductase subunit D